MNVLLLSPHPDDIAWSLGGTVARLADAGASLSVLTVFGRTTYAPGSPVHGTSAAGPVRAAEDATWAAFAGARLFGADLPDASLRGYDDDTEMGAPPEPEIVSDTAETLASVLLAARPDLLLVPLAVGGHVDHRAARSAAERVVADEAPGRALIYYEDLPYAAGVHRPHTGHPVLVDVAGCHARREAGARCYPSQEPHLILPVIAAHTSAAGGERLWAATAAAAQGLALFLAGAQVDQNAPAGRNALPDHAPAGRNTDAPLPRMEFQPW
ncbi:PIG-L deacetylase family protein [Actinoallomurus rhizosphaericola]|uniref:PIG-L deacetylase family protein n=1 Tax=Actinoallomurus rhizosphaericola TaxID=2952536 RepID=UPI00209256EA|nr:PIG-L family deacetylase [Actinoallomurus rhizosphaericola]MCO5999555.1 PIG-L family deacetylase [Actinoallomurus rhizosphaericola]